MGKYTHKKRIYGGIPPTPPPLPPLYKKSKETEKTEEKFKKRLEKLYEKMREAEEEERSAEKFDNLMIWASRGTGKKYEPQSKKWKTAVSVVRKLENIRNLKLIRNIESKLII